jgi:hypothetical protein
MGVVAARLAMASSTAFAVFLISTLLGVAARAGGR